MNNTLRILVIEDSEEDYFLIMRKIQKERDDFRIKRTDTSETLIKDLKDFEPDIILADHSLPNFDSNTALKLVRSFGSDAPFILVTGAVEDEFAVQAIKVGMSDYVLKTNLSRLNTVISNALKHKESERLRIKSKAELARRNDELTKINKELDSFVYSVSHNLRSPLKSVLGLLNLAKTENDPRMMEYYHTMMESSIKKLDASLADILEYSRSSRQESRFEPVDLRKIIEENFEKMAFMPGFKSFSTEIAINQQVELWSDKYRVSIIFNNLISNSIKYSDEKKPAQLIKITMDVTSESASIQFSDNGVGIDQHALPQIFQMFFRATEKNEGSGLGLFIVKEAIDTLKGTITVDSIKGAGTSFTIIIPNELRIKPSNSSKSILIDRD